MPKAHNQLAHQPASHFIISRIKKKRGGEERRGAMTRLMEGHDDESQIIMCQWRKKKGIHPQRASCHFVCLFFFLHESTYPSSLLSNGMKGALHFAGHLGGCDGFIVLAEILRKRRVR